MPERPKASRELPALGTVLCESDVRYGVMEGELVDFVVRKTGFNSSPSLTGSVHS